MKNKAKRILLSLFIRRIKLISNFRDFSMNIKMKNILLLLAILCILTGIVFVGFGCHPDPVFNIGNNFSQTVTVYFNGQKMGNINTERSKKFYPNEVLTESNSELLVEFKSASGTVLYSKLYTWDELTEVLESVHGNPYWIGPGTQ
jgi:hypothetical protein